MNSRIASRLATMAALPLLIACDEGAGPAGPNVEISVAPLVLPSVVGVSYGLTVYNGQPTFNAAGVQTAAVGTVWSKTPVTSGDYGNLGGGDITYIGPCDANTPLGAPNWNYVALVLNQIQVPNNEGSLGTTKEYLDDQVTSTDGDADFENPCPSTTPCVLSFKCVENADTLVQFNLTVMRDANQGFFDIAVNFEDVFCSAKLDTCYPDADGVAPVVYEPIKLLFGSSGREHTAVAALACTVGPDTATKDIATRLLFTTPTVSCTGTNGSVPFNLAVADKAAGNQTPVVSAGYTLDYSLYFGAEDLACGTAAGTEHLKDTQEHWLYGPRGEYYATQDVNVWQLHNASGGIIATASSDVPPVSFSVSDGQGGTTSIGRYFGTRPLSCNKLYYNLAINIQALAAQGLANCQFRWGATAIEVSNTTTFTSGGALADTNGVYGAIGYGNATNGVPLTGALTNNKVLPICDANPVNGMGLDGKNPSAVRGGYIAGSGFSGGGFVTGVTFDNKFNGGTSAKAIGAAD